MIVHQEVEHGEQPEHGCIKQGAGCNLSQHLKAASAKKQGKLEVKRGRLKLPLDVTKRLGRLIWSRASKSLSKRPPSDHLLVEEGKDSAGIDHLGHGGKSHDVHEEDGDLTRNRLDRRLKP